MTTGSKRVLFSAAGLAVLLIAGLFIAQAGGNDGNSPSDGKSASPTESSPSPDSSSTPSGPKEQVREAYLQQWDVYTEAVRVLTMDGLDDVFTGRALEVVTSEIKRRRREGTPLDLRVEHDFAVRIVDATTAVVDDRYIYRATDLDPDTGEPGKRYPPDLIHELYTLKKVNGEWKVSAIFRQSIKPAKR
jgi:hypothetical protein